MVFEGRRWTYSDLFAEAEQCASALIASGVIPGTHVGVLMGTRAEFVILTYGIAMAGGVSVLLSTFSGSDELDWVLRHSDAALLVVHGGVRGRKTAADLIDRHPALVSSPAGEIDDPSFPMLRRVVVVPNAEGEAPPGLETWTEFVAASQAVPISEVESRINSVSPTDPGMLLYTSGSTAEPKAVLHMHRAPVMQSFRMADAMAIGPADRTWTSFPAFWTAGWTTAIGGPFAVGASTILQEFFDPAEALTLIERERITSVRQMVHDEIRVVKAYEEDPRDLTSVTVGVVTESLKALTSVAYEISEICAWGMTETFTLATLLPFDAPYELRRATMGRVTLGNHIRIRDLDTGDEVADGEVGEITVAGMSLMLGYYKADPYLPLDAAGFLQTNDSGYLTADGLLVFTGRLDRLIKTAGANVSPIEVEEILQQWGRLGTCAVIGVPHPTLGAAIVLCAVRDPSATSPITENEVKSYLRSVTAGYKVPREVLFFEEEEIPLTLSSKVQVADLRELAILRLLGGDVAEEWRTHLEQLKD
jgi:fatty-acyl-CoA synthase